MRFVDFRCWHFSDVTAGLRSVCCWGKSGSRDCVAQLPSLTLMYGPAVRCKWILPSWR